MRLSEIMHTPVETIAADDSVASARARCALNGIHHLVVTRHGDVGRVLSTTDLDPWIGAESEEALTVTDVMEAPVLEATPATTVRQAANLLLGHHASCLPILNHGRLAGVVTITDLLRLLGRGAERPSPATERWLLKNRGQAPQGEEHAKLLHQAKAGTRPGRRS